MRDTGNGALSQVKDRFYTSKNHWQVILWVVALSVILTGNADATAIGVLEIQNYVNSTIGMSPLDLCHYEDSVGATDGYDNSLDVDVILPDLNRCSIYSDIVTNKLRIDCRSILSTTAFDVKLIYNGNLTSSKENRLAFSLPYGDEWKFGDKPILFQSDLLSYGSVVDVRRAISDNNGIVPLTDLAAGTYSSSTPYGSGILTIGTRKLADLNDDGTANLQDLAIMNQGWKKTHGKYDGDISGLNGIPDGYVNEHDLSVFSEDWLR